jgi:hypothetical protein
MRNPTNLICDGVCTHSRKRSGRFCCGKRYSVKMPQSRHWWTLVPCHTLRPPAGTFLIPSSLLTSPLPAFLTLLGTLGDITMHRHYMLHSISSLSQCSSQLINLFSSDRSIVFKSISELYYFVSIHFNHIRKST